MKTTFLKTILCFLFSCIVFKGYSQNIQLILAGVDGVELSPDNIFNYQIYNTGNKPVDVHLKGTVRFRNSELRIAYDLDYKLQPGINILSSALVRPHWQFSSQALRELFLDYRKLPQGTYEYCVSLQEKALNPEASLPNPVEECLYHKVDDIFLINLINPENDAKIYEHYPMLSWIVNYPFASQLTYKLRIAAIQEGQNTANAIVRNNPVYSEKGLMQTSLVYPIYAKPLIVNQPYAWTVDAYYKGILLGGAEPWKFTIIEDSLLASIPRNPSFVDIKREKNTTTYYVVGELKIKYVLDDARRDTLSLQLRKGEKEIKLDEDKLNAVYGDNRFIINFKDKRPLKHMAEYEMKVTSQNGSVYILPFKYVNPDFLN